MSPSIQFPVPIHYFLSLCPVPSCLKNLLLCLHLFSFLSFSLNFFLSILYSVNFKFCFYGYFYPVHCLYFLILSCLSSTLLLLWFSFYAHFYQAPYPYFCFPVSCTPLLLIYFYAFVFFSPLLFFNLFLSFLKADAF